MLYLKEKRMNKYIKIIGVWGTTAATSVGLTVAGYTDISSNIITGSTAVCFLTGVACAVYDLRASRVANDVSDNTRERLEINNDMHNKLEAGELRDPDKKPERPGTPNTDTDTDTDTTSLTSSSTSSLTSSSTSSKKSKS